MRKHDMLAASHSALVPLYIPLYAYPFIQSPTGHQNVTGCAAELRLSCTAIMAMRG